MIYVQMYKPTLFRRRKLIASLFYPWQLKSHIKVVHTVYMYIRTGTLLVTNINVANTGIIIICTTLGSSLIKKVRGDLQRGSLNLIQTIDNVHSMLNNGIRRFFGNLLNINTSLLAAHQYWSLQFTHKNPILCCKILRIKVKCYHMILNSV